MNKTYVATVNEPPTLPAYLTLRGLLTSGTVPLVIEALTHRREVAP